MRLLGPVLVLRLLLAPSRSGDALVRSVHGCAFPILTNLIYNDGSRRCSLRQATHSVVGCAASFLTVRRGLLEARLRLADDLAQV
jgi:hypothetical protein